MIKIIFFLLVFVVFSCKEHKSKAVKQEKVVVEDRLLKPSQDPKDERIVKVKTFEVPPTFPNQAETIDTEINNFLTKNKIKEVISITSTLNKDNGCLYTIVYKDPKP